MEKNFITNEKYCELVRIIRRWGKDDVLDVSDLDIRWSIWDDNDTECNDDDAVILAVKQIRIKDDDIEIGWVQGTRCAFESIYKWDFSEDHGGSYSNLAEYIYEEVIEAYYYECSVAVLDYDNSCIDIIKIPLCVYYSFDDAKDWVCSMYPQYKHRQIMVMAYQGDITISEQDYNDNID